MYIFTIQYPLIIGPSGGSAEQPLLALGGKALNQPKNRIEPATGNHIFGLRRFQTGMP